MSRMNLSALIPPPYLVQRRAWECGYMLATEYQERLDQRELEWCAWRVAQAPDRLGWDDIGGLLRLYRAHVRQRV